MMNKRLPCHHFQLYFGRHHWRDIFDREIAMKLDRRISLAIVGTVLVLSVWSFHSNVFAKVPASKHDAKPQQHWVAAWEGSPTPAGTFNSEDCPSDIGLHEQTIRNIVFVSAGGSFVRARISNAYGNTPLAVGAATIAISDGGAGIVAESLRTLHFAGKRSILIAAGGEAVSDPVDLPVKPLQKLAISIYLSGSTGPATQHYYADQDNFLAAGDHAADGGTAFPRKISCWMFLSDVEVKAAPRVIGTLAALGDSITDGYLSTKNADHRYPDYLARRLAARKGATLSVVNAGIIGNEVLALHSEEAHAGSPTSGPMEPQWEFGYPVQARIARDVLLQAGARAVILLEGINDIGANSAKAEELIAADRQIIQQVHAAGLKIYGATLVPFGGSHKKYNGEYGTASGEGQRQMLNRWIRTSGAFDGVIDFDKAVRDPSDPSRLLPAYDGDDLHPNDAGYEAMAKAVNLDSILHAIQNEPACSRK
jgi:lysophospholipase L1-like esterase